MFTRAVTKSADLVIGTYDVLNTYKLSAVHTLDNLVTLDDIDKYNTDILWTFSLSNKLFKRELIEKYTLRFPDISYSEDGAFLVQFLYRSSMITGLNQVIFHYRRYNEEDAPVSYTHLDVYKRQ